MFSKPIFKQSIQSNKRLWIAITIVGSIILSGFIISYDATDYASIASAAEGTAFSNLLSSLTSLLGSLENFYKLIGVILGIVYVVFTANNLVVSEVDSGSLAYTLSTPIKRLSVIFTKSVYLISSVVLMYSIIFVVGLGASQFTYKNVTGYPITDDVRIAADLLNHDESYMVDRMYLIKDNEQIINEAALARNMDADAYRIYLEQRIHNHSYDQVADVITSERQDIYKNDDDMDKDDIEITKEELKADPALILQYDDALREGAKVEGISVNQYQEFIQKEIEELEVAEQTVDKAEQEEKQADEDEEPSVTVEVTEANAEIFLQHLTETTASSLGMDINQIQKNLSLVKQPEAMKASIETTQLTEEQIIQLINQAMIMNAHFEDDALDFDFGTYAWLSVGLLLLILTMSAIAFFASTLFNRTSLALAFGGGIPFAFFLVTMVQQLMDSKDTLKYLTITSLVDTDAIFAGEDFLWKLLVLGAISIVLYVSSNVLFTKKDLPL